MFIAGSMKARLWPISSGGIEPDDRLVDPEHRPRSPTALLERRHHDPLLEVLVREVAAPVNDASSR